MTSGDAEPQELERAIERLGRSTRPGRLLEYVGRKYFENPQAQLTEVDIAIDVFGRSAKNFDSTADAVVRVEAHRLRKKLRDIYENDRRVHGLQISLPAGTYLPQFTAIPEPNALPAQPAAPPAVEPAGPRRTVWTWVLGLGVGVAIAAVFLVVALNGEDSPADAPAARAAPAQTSGNAAAGALTEVHMLAGHTGSEVIDNSGVRWTPDRYFANGGRWSREAGFVRGTSRPFLFANWRTGEFGYDIPMAPGSYELRLFFVSPFRVGEEKMGAFNVALHGKPLLNSYDIVMSANGADVADERVFRDVTPDQKGFVRLWFSNLAGSPLLNGLSLTPGTPGRLNPIRITMQPTSYVDHQGQRWRADDYYQNGFASAQRRKVSGTEDPELFGSERFGHFSYAIPVDKRGRYTVVLYFAEFYHGAQLPGGGGAGSRVFHVFCNGQTLLRDFDIYKEAGSLKVVSKSFPNIAPSAQGKINLMFEPVTNNATLSGIEILDESR
jgi:hypothetical protein